MPAEADKEIDRLIKLIEQISRLDTKVDILCKQYTVDLNNMKEMLTEQSKKAEKLQEEHEDLKDLFVKLQVSYDKYKWVWGALAIIITPIITTLVILWLHAVIGF